MAGSNYFGSLTKTISRLERKAKSNKLIFFTSFLVGLGDGVRLQGVFADTPGAAWTVIIYLEDSAR
jgi:hypothetical protein